MNMYDLTLRQLNHDKPIPARFDADMDWQFVQIYSQVKLNDYTPLQLYLMINQKIMIDVLIPLAMEILYVTPMIKGKYQRGDLLQVVVEADKYYWLANPEMKQTLEEILNSLKSTVDHITERYDLIMTD